MNRDINYFSRMPEPDKEFPPQDNPPIQPDPGTDKPPVEIKMYYEGGWDEYDEDVLSIFIENIYLIN